MVFGNVTVKKKLLDCGLSVTELAALTGYSRSYLSGVINGRLPGQRARKVIALALREEYETLWDGNLIRSAADS